MPNWASIEYKIVGKHKQLENLYKRIDKLYKVHKTDLWLVHISDNFNIKPLDGMGIRGYIVYYDYSPGDDYMTIGYDGAWGEQEGFRYILEQKYKGIKIYFYEEEFGIGSYFSNDVNHEFFDNKYIVFNQDGEYYYTTNLDNALEMVREFTGIDNINKDNYAKILDESLCSIEEIQYGDA